MKVYQKWEDMAAYLYIALKSYPKSERFTLAADTARALWKIGTCITRANAVGNNNKSEKRKAVETADISLVELKVLVRMGMRLEFLPLKKYEILAGQITEVGKMIGGWIKSIQ
jgi:four helix bundle protein